MPEFYYERSSEESGYHIDEISQQILVYLYSRWEVTVGDLVEKVGGVSESEIHERIVEQLGPDASGLITHPETTQETFGDEEPPTYYTLSEEGERFVVENKATLSMPADFKELADTVGDLRTEVIEIRDSMHRVDVDELSEQLSTLAHRLESLQAHLSNYD